MKGIFPFLVFVLTCTLATAQDKYAVILSALPQSSGAEKTVARNNFRLICKALQVQGFSRAHIFSDTSMMDRAKVLSTLVSLSQRVKKGDFVLVYSDLPVFSKDYGDNTWGRVLKLGGSGDNEIALADLKSEFSKIAAKVGDESDMFFSVFDAALSAPLPGTLREKIYKPGEAFSLNLMVATSSHLQERVIKNGESIFTRAVASTLMNGSVFNQTYQTFSNSVRKEVYLASTKQVTAIDGYVDRQLFRGMFTRFPAHFSVVATKGKQVTINAGSGLGFEKEATVKFYKAFTSPTESAFLGEGVITSVNSLGSIVQVTKPLPTGTETWAYVKANDKLVKLQFNTSYQGRFPGMFQKLVASVKTWASSSLYLDYVTKGGDIGIGDIRELKDSAEYTFINPANGSIYTKIVLPNTLHSIDPIQQLVLQHARFKEIYRLQNYIPELSVTAELIPVSPNATYENDYLIINENNTFKIKITNTGTVPVFFNILDMLGDKTCKVIVPYDGESPEDFRIIPGSYIEFDEVVTDEYSFGIERLKIFTSLHPLDLRSVANRSLTRSTSNTGLSLLDNDYGRSTRGSTATRLNYEEINIVNVDMEIRSAGYAKDRSVKKEPELGFGSLASKSTNIRLRNTTQETIYFNVLAQQPDGSFSVVYPSGNVHPYDCYVKFDSAGEFNLPKVFAENEQVMAVYSDRPFHLADHTNAEKDLNQLLLGIMREGRIPGTPLNKMGVLHQLYRPATLATTERAGSNLAIKLLTPKVANERALNLKAKTRTFELAGMAYTEGYLPVKTIKINGDVASYDPNLKLFERSLELQSGKNRVVIEATDEKGFSLTQILEVELEGSNTLVKGEGKNYFLGIGINKYKLWPELFNAEDDVIRFANLLKSKYNFAPGDVTLLLDTAANRKNIIKNIRYYLSKAGPNDNVIIYLSGHGNEDQLAAGDYYFIPQESDPDDVATAVKSTDIVDNFKRIKAMHCVLIVDACYSGMITNSVYGVGSTIATQKNNEVELPSKWIITSGRATKVLDGEKGKNSPFAASLINYLQDNTDPSQLRIGRIISYLEDVVPKISNQKPLGKKIEGEGELIFKKK